MNKSDSVTGDIIFAWTLIAFFLRYSGAVDWPWVAVWGPVAFSLVMTLVLLAVASLEER